MTLSWFPDCNSITKQRWIILFPMKCCQPSDCWDVISVSHRNIFELLCERTAFSNSVWCLPSLVSKMNHRSAKVQNMLHWAKIRFQRRLNKACQLCYGDNLINRLKILNSQLLKDIQRSYWIFLSFVPFSVKLTPSLLQQCRGSWCFLCGGHYMTDSDLKIIIHRSIWPMATDSQPSSSQSTPQCSLFLMRLSTVDGSIEGPHGSQVFSQVFEGLFVLFSDTAICYK